MDLLTFITSELLRDLVCQAGDWGSVRPRPRPIMVGRGPDGAVDRTPFEEAGKENCFSPLMAGVLIFAKANHMASKVPNDLDTVAKPPGCSVGTKLGYCSLTAIR